jgi:hypothetical protein
VPVHAREPFLFPLSAYARLAVEQLHRLVRTYRHGRVDARAICDVRFSVAFDAAHSLDQPRFWVAYLTFAAAQLRGVAVLGRRADALCWHIPPQLFFSRLS